MWHEEQGLVRAEQDEHGYGHIWVGGLETSHVSYRISRFANELSEWV